jgi:hypothetical protein
LWYFAEVRAVGKAKCARFEEAGASLTFKKRGRTTRALGLGGGTCIHYLYDQTTTGICVHDRSKRLDIVLDDLGSKKIMATRNRIILATAEVMADMPPMD